MTTQRDAAGRATAIGESAGGTTPYTSTFGYNLDDQPTTMTVPGGVQELAQFDPGSRLTSIAATGPTTATNPLNSSYAYSYTATSWTSVETDTVNTINGGQPVVQTYGHDPLGRLTSVQGPNGTQSYGYDGNGNITAITTSAGTTTYAYSGTAADAANELTSVIAPSQPITSYGYDGMGDTTSITDTAGATTSLSYDKRERLIGVTLSDGTQVSIAYNAQGQRASYTVSKGGTTSLSEVFTYRNGALGQAVVTGASVTTPYTDTYLYAPDGNPLELLRQQGGTTSRYWYVLDGRDNVVALTSITGTVVDRYGYGVWGQPIASQTSETVPQPLRYAGYWYDKELGWYWVSVREYDPQIARWLQPDPSGQDGVRTYAYAGDDPIDVTDPTGLQGGGIAVGAWAVCATTFEIPFLGEVDCGGALVIIGVVAVNNIIRDLLPPPHAAPPHPASGARSRNRTHTFHIQGLTPSLDEHGNPVLVTPKGRYVSENHILEILEREDPHAIPTGQEIDDTIDHGEHETQANGYDVYISSQHGRYTIVVEDVADEIIVTAITDLTYHQLENLRANYEHGK